MVNINLNLAQQLISKQFPEYAHLPITSVEKQGHDNRTYRLGSNMLIRMPTAESYALKVPKEQDLLPKLKPHITVNIPIPIKMGVASQEYPYPFSIYEWLPGKSINLIVLDNEAREQLAFDLARFLKELQNITDVDGPPPGQHNWWRGDHIGVYNQGARKQIAELAAVIDATRSLALWEKACATHWKGRPLWVHGDLAIGNLLIEREKLCAVIDFGGIAVGDPACDLVIAWTYLSGRSREIFIREMNFDCDTWLRARAWALWKATYELCHIADKNSPEAAFQKQIIDAALCE